MEIETYTLYKHIDTQTGNCGHLDFKQKKVLRENRYAEKFQHSCRMSI
jgi:hypothetical protein